MGVEAAVAASPKEVVMSDLIKAAKLWAKTSQKTGGTYYVGRMGGCRVLGMENRDRQGEGEPTHRLLLGDAEGGQAQPQQQQQPRADQRPLSLDRPPAGGS